MAGKTSTKERLYEIIFEADTYYGKLFDVLLLVVIIASVVVVCLESMATFRSSHGALLIILEWTFTIVFTIEYIFRLYAVRKSWKYALSFYGIIDFLAILPTYLSVFLIGSQSLAIIRALRLLRVFRIFKLGNYMAQGGLIVQAIKQSRGKILVFLYFIFLMVTVIGAMMYFIEGANNEGFDSIPRSIYWAIVTLTTVGYGDITPQTNLGQFISALVMILGYSVIAVPTGIVSSQMVSNYRSKVNTRACPSCGKEGHDSDSTYCKFCGELLFTH